MPVDDSMYEEEFFKKVEAGGTYYVPDRSPHGIEETIVLEGFVSDGGVLGKFEIKNHLGKVLSKRDFSKITLPKNLRANPRTRDGFCFDAVEGAVASVLFKELEKATAHPAKELQKQGFKDIDWASLESYGPLALYTLGSLASERVLANYCMDFIFKALARNVSALRVYAPVFESLLSHPNVNQHFTQEILGILARRIDNDAYNKKKQYFKMIATDDTSSEDVLAYQAGKMLLPALKTWKQPRGMNLHGEFAGSVWIDTRGSVGEGPVYYAGELIDVLTQSLAGKGRKVFA